MSPERTQHHIITIRASVRPYRFDVFSSSKADKVDAICRQTRTLRISKIYALDIEHTAPCSV